MAALDHRRRTGCGQYIDLSQYENGLQFIAPALLDYEANGEIMTHDGNRQPDAAPHGVYPCRGDDTWAAVSAFSDEEWKSLARAIGKPEWADDSKFATLAARKQNEDEIDDAVAGWTRQFKPRQVMETLQAAGVPAAAVNTLGDLFSDPQLLYRRIWRELDHPVLERFHYEAPPFELTSTPADNFRSPLLGEHNRMVLGDILGLSDAEIEELTNQGVVE
jgi:benzylsuccinate CoA-transferase BbsF subunit